MENDVSYWSTICSPLIDNYLSQGHNLLDEYEQIKYKELTNSKYDTYIKIKDDSIYYFWIFCAMILFGIIFTCYGFINWRKRQNKLDKLLDYELQSKEYEIKKLSKKK